MTAHISFRLFCISRPRFLRQTAMNSPTPPDGVPFPWGGELDHSIYSQYLNDVTQKLNAADPNAFSPSLSLLDALIQSIEIGSVDIN